MYVDYQHQQFNDDQATFLKELAKSIPYDGSDIEENKKGRLSSAQMTRLAFKTLGTFAAIFGVGAGVIALAMGIYFAAPYIMLKITLLLKMSSYLLVIGGALFFGMIAFIIKFLMASGRAILLVQDLMEGKVVSVTGRLNPSKAESVEDGLDKVINRKTETYNFVVKGEYFEVSEEAHELMTNYGAGNFQLWVTPRSRYLVAMEPASAELTKDPFKLEYKSYSE